MELTINKAWKNKYRDGADRSGEDFLRSGLIIDFTDLVFYNIGFALAKQFLCRN
jgi:hypothetical protein